MAHQLLATFYVESDRPLEDITVTAEVQSFSESDWSADSTMSTMTGSGNFFIEVGNAHHTNGDRRYKIDVFRRDVNAFFQMPGTTGEQFPLFKAGTYERRLSVRFNGIEVLTRPLYITVNPHVEMWQEENGVAKTELVKTTMKSGAGSNPVNHVVEVKPVNQTTTPDKINLGSSNKFKDTVFIKANLPIDAFCEDFSLETEPGGMMMSVSTWLRLAEKIRMTRKIGTTASQWSAGTPPMGSSPIKTDPNEYVNFITDSALTTSVYYTGTELGLEKLPLVLPLHVQSELKLHGLPVDRYTGTGTTKAKTSAIVLPLTVILKTPHAVKITPEVLTLDEDNNYTSFVAVETNDEASYRDTISYFGILLDDNNRKPICRLYFNSPKKFIAVFDENKKEVRSELPSIDDIFKYADAMVKTIENYDNPQSKKSGTEQPFDEGFTS